MAAAMNEGLADQLGELLRLLDGSDVEELEVEHAGARFLVRRDLSDATPVTRVAVARPIPPPRADSFVITAPVVGVFRRNAGGKGEAILDAGDGVMAGQVVGAVEAMGMLNRIQSERTGVVQEMLVRDGQPVEYGQPLLVVHEP
jgi:acetyl-CoA carboxylase biotin carboxyl carrier protein